MARSLTCWRYPWARARTRIGRGWPRRGWNRARCSLLCSVGTRVNQPAMPVPARVGNGVATRVSTSASWDAVETWAPAKEKQKQQFFIIIPYPSYRFLANFRSVFCLLGAYDNFFVCLFQFFFFFFERCSIFIREEFSVATLMIIESLSFSRRKRFSYIWCSRHIFEFCIFFNHCRINYKYFSLVIYGWQIWI